MFGGMTGPANSTAGPTTAVPGAVSFGAETAVGGGVMTGVGAGAPSCARAAAAEPRPAAIASATEGARRAVQPTARRIDPCRLMCVRSFRTLGRYGEFCPRESQFVGLCI